jgi:hypothetical protein
VYFFVSLFVGIFVFLFVCLFACSPECERRCEVAEEEVRDGQGEDERVSRVETKLGRAEDDRQEDQVEDRAHDHDRQVQPEEKVKGVVRHFRVPLKQANRLKVRMMDILVKCCDMMMKLLCSPNENLGEEGSCS